MWGAIPPIVRFSYMAEKVHDACTFWWGRVAYSGVKVECWAC